MPENVEPLTIAPAAPTPETAKAAPADPPGKPEKRFEREHRADGVFEREWIPGELRKIPTDSLALDIVRQALKDQRDRFFDLTRGAAVLDPIDVVATGVVEALRARGLLV